MSKSAVVAKGADSLVPVDPDQTLKACKALVAHIKKSAAAPRNDGKQNLLADEESTVAETPVWLTLTTKKHIHDSHRRSPGVDRRSPAEDVRRDTVMRDGPS
jgi:ribosome biogenesis protein UTP30